MTKKALRKPPSPDRLDQLLRVVKPQSWILLVSAGLGIALILLWGVFGTIPISVEGSGILVYPKKVVAFHSPSTGHVDSWSVSVGDIVQEGVTVLGTLDLPDIQDRLDREHKKLEQLEARDDKLGQLERDRAQRERELIAAKRARVERRAEDLCATAEAVQGKKAEYIAEQRQNLDTATLLSERLAEVLASRLESYEQLQAAGGATLDAVIDARRHATENELRLAELEVQARALHLAEIQAQEAFDERQDLIAELEIQVRDLDLRIAQIDRELAKGELESEGHKQDIEREIALLQSQLSAKGQIKSEYTGRILEITTTVGQLVPKGQRLGRVEIADEGGELQALAYFPVKDGKRILPGTQIHVTPITVERDRFGGLLAEVTQVSDYPVTTGAAAFQIGDRAIATSLLAGENKIEVKARLERSETSPTGYLWSWGDGPPLQITAGTTAQIRVTVEEWRPIELVLPYVRKFSGIQ